MAELKSLADLVQPDRVKRALAWMIERRNGELSTHIYHQVTAAKAIARHWVRLPDDVIAVFSDMARRTNCHRPGLKPRNRRRLQQFEDPRNVDNLVNLPQALAREARNANRDLLFHARLMRAAVAIEILLMTAIRMKNLTMLQVDQHLHWSRPGRKGKLFLVIPAEDVKNGNPIERELPKDSAALITRYVNDWLPVFLGRSAGHLFPGRTSPHLDPGQFSQRLSKLIRKRTGLDVNGHLFRHIGAKIYLDTHPGAYEVVRLVHGHSTVDTTIDHYVGLESMAAGQAYDDVLMKHRGRRRGATRVTRRPRRRESD